jgi:hypothetical protein
MSQARDLADLGGSADAGGITGRNLVINGAATVSQRGDSTGKTATGYYGPDRYQLNLSSLGTWSISQSTTVPSGEGFANSYKLEATTADASPAASDYALFLQKIEGQNLQQLKKGTANAESVTLSFYVRSSKTGTYIVELFDNDNSRSISKSYTISSANTWERKTITFPGDTTGTLGNDNASSLEINWYLAAGSTYTSGTLQTSWGTRTAANQAVGQVNMADTANATWFITGLQLEVGQTATPFEHEDFGTTLRKCERYTLLTPNLLLPKMREADRYRCGTYEFRTTMRAAPTFPAVTDGAGISVTVQDITTRGAVCYAVVPTDGHGSMISDGIVVSAEL